ncbi:MAG: gliding motility-associated C-terminal domain-containing protein [Chitinophagales bacterium]|nr:gliding motility-associated C-terminal domain-containing protein [Chitinophagales bacterium]
MRGLTILLFACCTLVVNATHIVGGFISYRFLSGTTYEVKMTIYRDCNSATPFDGVPGSTTDAILGIFVENTNNLFNTVNLINPVITTIQPPNNPCLQTNASVCVEQGVYTTTITLPSSTTGYTLIHERCCRNGTITNVFDPGNQGAVYSAYIPPTNPYQNTSPVFNALPPLFVCVNSPLVFDYSATDVDGDVLTYSLCTPLHGGTAQAPAPNPPLGPPYSNVPWQTPYSTANLLGGTPLTINSNTGVLTGTPNSIGQFVVGVCVSEYRNGQLLGTYLRDFQFNVTQCNAPAANIPSTNINPQTGIGLYVQNCQNYTVTFQNNTYNPPPTNVPLTYHWDFGVPSLTNDTSNQQFPTYVYPDTGTYLVKLIVVKGSGANACTDTTYAYVRIYPTLNGDFGTADVCQTVAATFTDLSTTTYGSINQWSWNFGDGNTSNQQNPTHQYTAPGTYTVTLINETTLGCKDTTQKAINVLAAASVDFSFPDPVCQNQAVNFTNNTNPSTANFNWNFGNGNTSTQSSPTVNFVPGSYQIKLVANINGSCADSLTKTLTVNPTPVVNISNDTIICPNTSAQLWAHDGVSYAWSPATGLSNPNAANPVATPVPPASVVYTVTVTNQYQCSASDDVLVSFFAPAQIFAGPDTSVCLNPGSYRDSVQLFAWGGVSYQWSPSGTLTGAFTAQPIARPTSNTTYTVTGTDANGCTATNSTMVYVLDPSLNIILDDYKGVCIGDTVSVNVINQGASNYAWSPLQSIANANSYSPSFFPTDTTTYTLTVSNYCYTKSDSVVITVWQLPVLVLDDADSVCLGESVQVYVSGAQSFLWDADNTITGTTTASPTVTPPASRFYYVNGTSVYGCVNRDSIWIEILPLPYVEAGNDTVIWRETFAVLQGVTNGSSFFWTPETDLETPNLLTTVSNTQKTQVYYLHATSGFGCTNYDSIRVIVEVVTILDLPTAFSPNGDGVNDKFRIVRWLNIQKLKEFAVYNRWGEKVFATNDLYEGWDGTFRNREQPMSTYVWYAIGLTKDGEEVVKKGNVTLVR